MWRFVQISDPHLGSVVDSEGNNRLLCTIMPDVMRCLRRDLSKLNPDLLLITGDIASQQTRDAVFAARDLLDSLGAPYYPAGGDHDFRFEKARELFIEAFQPNLPDGDTVYSFTHKNLHFCVLDPWWQWRDESLHPSSETGEVVQGRWAVPPNELAWLEEDLDAHAAEPTLIAMHYPAVPIPERLRRSGMKNPGHLENGPLLIDLLHRYPQVKAIMAGHVHMHFVEQTNGLTHVTTGSLPEFPIEYRDIHVYPDRLEVHTCGLSNTTFAAKSLINGRSWVAGDPDDRQAIIPL